MHIERILHTQGFGTRRECRALVRLGRVTVAGAPCDDPFAEYEFDHLEFTVDGVPWQARQRAYLMLNKPGNYECSRRPIHNPSVFTLLPPPLLHRGVQPVGRLDADTSGLLLFSDDGDFIHGLSSPKREIAKIYEVGTRHPADEALRMNLLAGVQLHDEPAPIAAADCRLTGERQLLLTITEGKYHPVKRMIAAAGNRVDVLRRVAIGALELPADLEPGQWRWLGPIELAALGFPRS